MTDMGPQSQRSPLVGQNIDLGYARESRRSYPPPVPGSLPVPTIRGDASIRETFQLADPDDRAPSTPQDLADNILHELWHATEYSVVLVLQELKKLIPISQEGSFSVRKDPQRLTHQRLAKP
jgi:hypothetical protein